jgi:putative ATPase
LGSARYGKTTLARLLAENSGLRFVPLSAVFSGVKDLREAIQEARKEANYGKRTLLFIDESIASTKRNKTRCCPRLRTEPSR